MRILKILGPFGVSYSPPPPHRKVTQVRLSTALDLQYFYICFFLCRSYGSSLKFIIFQFSVDHVIQQPTANVNLARDSTPFILDSSLLFRGEWFMATSRRRQ